MCCKIQILTPWWILLHRSRYGYHVENRYNSRSFNRNANNNHIVLCAVGFRIILCINAIQQGYWFVATCYSIYSGTIMYFMSNTSVVNSIWMLILLTVANAHIILGSYCINMLSSEDPNHLVNGNHRIQIPISRSKLMLPWFIQSASEY
jgi:hypothetical protein